MKEVLKKSKYLFAFFLALSFLGCDEDDDSTNLPEVVAGFTFTQNEETGTITFINISEEATSYEWNFGDGETSTEINPVKTYTTGTYTVSLEASNASGASDTFEDEITVLLPEAIMLPITFDGANVDYTPSVFGGASFEVVDNPAPGGTNDTASKVGAITNGGAAFEGLFFDLGIGIDLTSEKTIKMNFWSDVAVDILMKLEEGNANPVEIVASHGGTGWEEISFDFTDAAEYARLTLFVDGPGTTAGTFYLDDIEQIETPLPIFDSGLIMNGDFESGDDPWIGGGRNIVTEGGNSFNLVDVMTAGNPFDVNLSQVVEITQGTNYILTFDASSNVARTILAGIGLNEAPFTNTAPSVNLTTDTQTFTLQLAANDFGGVNSRILFDMGAEVGTVVIDNVSLVEGGDGSDTNGGSGFDSGLLTNGDFESGDDPWIGSGRNIITDGGNSFNSVDVTVAGNPFDVNLSQVLDLTQDADYILTFDASSDRNRTIIAGIGLNVDPFTNVNEVVSLTTDTQTFTLNLNATGFGGADSRVLFDMGAEVGTVIIDNVALVLDEGGGGGCTGTVVAATALPLDFEGCESFVDSFTGASTITVELATNEFKEGINTSDNVLKVVKGNGATRWAGIQNTFASNFDLNATPTFKMKVRSTKANVVFRFELIADPTPDPDPGNPPPTFVTIPNANEWTEISVVFTGVPDPTAYNRMVIKPDNPEGSDGTNTDSEETYYIDDMIVE